MLRRQSTATPDALPVDADSRLSLIRVFDDRVGLPEPLLSPKLLDQFRAIVHERLSRERLAAHGITPTRSAILVGPPGVGKTLSARWVASQLKKSLWVLDLTAVMSSLLGKTGNNVRTALDHAKENEAVLLLDEIDAIAKRRSDETDIGELKRLVTVILQEVDNWPDTGLLLAATNHPELVDPALWRRFDIVLPFEPPSEIAIEAAVRRFLGPDLRRFEPWVKAIALALREQSLADIERKLMSLRRTAVLADSSPEQLITPILDGLQNVSKADRLKLAIELARSPTFSHHEINRLTGVARDTIRKHAGPSTRRGRGRK